MWVDMKFQADMIWLLKIAFSFEREESTDLMVQDCTIEHVAVFTSHSTSSKINILFYLFFFFRWLKDLQLPNQLFQIRSYMSVSWQRFHQIDLNQSHLGTRSLDWGIASIRLARAHVSASHRLAWAHVSASHRLAWAQSVRAFSWLMIMGGASPLWVVPLLSW
jgi:hypothetical protein